MIEKLNPEKINKYLYIENTTVESVKVIYIFSLIFWILLVIGYIPAIINDSFYTYFAAPIIFVITIYYVISYSLHMYYKDFDMDGHKELMSRYWDDNKDYPSVDIYLPICGEDVKVLENTWHYVSKLDYNKDKLKVYVLDDSRVNVLEHKSLSEKYGFVHIERENKGWMKKAGNLNNAFKKTNGEFIIIFDADFAPKKEFIKEILPYMEDENVGILQTPQFFPINDSVNRGSILEYGAGYTQELFYRFIQVSRSNFNAAICCGSNAVYRRSALNKVGGTALIEHSEDARTGFSLQEIGYKVKYLPIILAIGICPNNVYDYFHQQHRWATGTLTLILSKQFWVSKINWKQKLCYWAGFLFYLQNPLSIIFSFQIFYVLYKYSDQISIMNNWLFYPTMFWGLYVLFFFNLHKFKPGVIIALFIQSYAYSHAVFSAFFGKTVGWVPTGSKKQNISPAFRLTTLAVLSYFTLYFTFVLFGSYKGYIQFNNYNHYPIIFWVYYFLFFSGVSVFSMFKVLLNKNK